MRFMHKVNSFFLKNDGVVLAILPILMCFTCFGLYFFVSMENWAHLVFYSLYLFFSLTISYFLLYLKKPATFNSFLISILIDIATLCLYGIKALIFVNPKSLVIVQSQFNFILITFFVLFFLKLIFYYRQRSNYGL